MRCSLCFRTFAVGTRKVRALRPVCWECAQAPRFVLGWRASTILFVGALFLGFQAGRWL